MNKSILLLAITSTLGTAAYAEDPPPAPPFTANISLTTNYKYRGQDQGSLTPTKAMRPAVQGGFDWTMNGFYVGNWNSSIGWIPDSLGGSSIEMDFYGGYRGEIVKDVGYDVGVLRYQYIGSGFANTTEIYGSVSYGPASLKYSHTVSEDYFGFAGAAFGSGFKGRGTGYLDLSGNFPVMDVLTINAHVGYTRFSSDIRDNIPDTNGGTIPNYYDYKLGVTYDMSKFAGAGVTLAGAVVGASKKESFKYSSDGQSVNKARFIVTLTKTM
ncbi:MAG TPA: TorF family putative porin [Burkholderiaceae bacterium]|nr:TorF family putative porin [Burkholderiaceae bacterium]